MPSNVKYRRVHEMAYRSPTTDRPPTHPPVLTMTMVPAVSLFSSRPPSTPQPWTQPLSPHSSTQPWTPTKLPPPPLCSTSFSVGRSARGSIQNIPWAMHWPAIVENCFHFNSRETDWWRRNDDINKTTYITAKQRNELRHFGHSSSNGWHQDGGGERVYCLVELIILPCAPVSLPYSFSITANHHRQFPLQTDNQTNTPFAHKHGNDLISE